MFAKIKEKILVRAYKKLYSNSIYRKINAVDIIKHRSSTNVDLSTSNVKYLLDASRLPAEDLCKKYRTSTNGLSVHNAERKLKQFGKNEITFEKKQSWLRHLWQCYFNPFNLLLTVLAAFSLFTDDAVGSSIIGAMVVLATILRFIQERRSKIAMDRLKVMVCNKVTVLRRDSDGHRENNVSSLANKIDNVVEIPMEDLVPGDIVLLSAGDMVPADVRVLSAKDLFISQSVLTGESLPVEKFAEHKASSDDDNILNLNNILFMGSNVVSGTSRGIVLATGNKTYFGRLATRVVSYKPSVTQFQKGINKVSMMLIQFMLIMAPIVFLINGITKGNWIEAALFALSVAVGLTPEMLPMIVTSTLAKGATFMAKKKVVVKKLEALQNFGAMDVLCTDKTGTLTQDKIALERHTDILGNEYKDVLSYAYINSFYQTGLKNLLDVAVLEHADLNYSKKSLVEGCKKIDEIPFDFRRRRMSVVVKSDIEDKDLLICKGALEEVLAVSSYVRKDGNDVPLTPDILASINKATTKLNKEGLRVVAVAIKQEDSKSSYSVSDEQDLTLIGYIAFLDPPKESTGNALKSLKDHNVAVKVLTGDNELVTRKVCKDVDFHITGILSGDQVVRMSDDDILKVIDEINIFVKLTPDHKERIVQLLQLKGHTVGFLGDGINDAAALRVADVGISVDTAVDITKEAADIILLEKSLMILESGVKEGRKTFANMLKYIRMTASSNFGNIFSVLIASAFIPFLPILPIQILIQNLLYDTSQVAIPFDHVDKETLKYPQKWNPKSLKYFMISFGPLSSIFDVITFMVLWYVYKANTAESASLFQSGWFLVGLTSQILIVHTIRTAKIPFIQSVASLPVLLMTVVTISIGVTLPFTHIGHSLGFVDVPFNYFFWAVAIIIAYMIATQVVKKIYIRRYGWT